LKSIHSRSWGLVEQSLEALDTNFPQAYHVWCPKRQKLPDELLIIIRISYRLLNSLQKVSGKQG